MNPYITLKEDLENTTIENASQQPGKSRNWLWIVLGSTIAVVLFMALVAGGTFFALHTFFQQTDQPVSVAGNYYLAFMTQDYTKAYADLDRQATIDVLCPVVQQSFTALATSADMQYGKVIGYSIDPSVQGNDPSRLTITVHRSVRTYQVHLQLKLEGNTWKIMRADGI